MYLSLFLPGALLVATASSAPSSHAGKTKSSSNYAVSYKGTFAEDDVDNADELSASRAQYTTAMTLLRSAQISSFPTAPKDFRRPRTATIHLMAGLA